MFKRRRLLKQIEYHRMKISRQRDFLHLLSIAIFESPPNSQVSKMLRMRVVAIKLTISISEMVIIANEVQLKQLPTSRYVVFLKWIKSKLHFI